MAENALVTNPNNIEKTKNKKHRIWPWLVGAGLIIIVTPILVLGFFGFMPGISSLMGTNKPKNLGVSYTAADYASYQQKTGAQFLDSATAPQSTTDPGSKEIFTNPKQMDVNLTQEEITAMLNSTGWALMPIKNAQVRLGNNTVEISGNLDASAISSFAKSIGGAGYSQSDIDTATSWAKLLGNPPIYIKANASITNNVLDLSVTEAKVGFLSIPASVTGDLLKAGSYNIKNNSAMYDVQHASATDGQLHFVGTAPTTIYINK